jgi:hypothetical protein
LLKRIFFFGLMVGFALCSFLFLFIKLGKF